MQHRNQLAVALLLVGSAALATAAVVLTNRADRPAGTGDIGVLEVYGQLPNGPSRLWPDRARTLARPQDVAFRLSVDGTGPRLVRIEVDTASERFIAYEQFHYAPTRNESLDFVLQLGETVPDQLDLLVTLEAPHTTAIVSRFPIVLSGPNRRFWEQ